MTVCSVFKNFYTYTCEKYPFPQEIDLKNTYQKYSLPQNIKNRKEIIETAQKISILKKNTEIINYNNHTDTFSCINNEFLIKKPIIRFQSTRKRQTFLRPFDSWHILRPYAADHFQKIITNKKIKNILISKKYIVKNKTSEIHLFQDTIINQLITSSVICEKLDVYSEKETIEKLKKIKEKKQKELAKSISEFILRTGYLDAYFHNILLTICNKIAIVDTEPNALLRISQEKNHEILNPFINEQKMKNIPCLKDVIFSLPLSLCRARILGLHNFIASCKNNQLPEIFEKTARKYLEKAKLEAKKEGKIIISRVILSIIFPIIFLILFIYSIAKCAIAQLQKWNLNRKNTSQIPHPVKC